MLLDLPVTIMELIFSFAIHDSEQVLTNLKATSKTMKHIAKTYATRVNLIAENQFKDIVYRIPKFPLFLGLSFSKTYKFISSSTAHKVHFFLEDKFREESGPFDRLSLSVVLHASPTIRFFLRHMQKDGTTGRWIYGGVSTLEIHVRADRIGPVETLPTTRLVESWLHACYEIKE